ncbi:MAG: poly-gamma-glutamate synthase PgsB/CapB [Pseudoalteromonas rhizosphaerae]|jgi:poly-gamma-glutamate synthase PgsB/CapB|uniref:Poly-gamma-glutamate synthase PgsB n=1 Tax=Pseudoalteromonas neustonica TaxID=1840331 RepID=A0ABY3FDL1_9GAMM|nr:MULTISPECIES: poly-gamma-glutamate synthase PgsB [Pseudoalteromonas]MBB1295290.1 poly-gamma-glutamate synthase PgsB [Pseudoalteromonas sp. SR41-4]TVU83479.1 poly-gamma-glutamate synthase PgsB [Pseudoalteromonas neustonica]
MANTKKVTPSSELKDRLEHLLFADIANFWLDLYRQKYRQLVDELAQWELLQNMPDGEDQDIWLLRQAIAFLRHRVEHKQQSLQKLDAGYLLFIERLSHAEISAEREFHILDYAQQLGATSEQLRQDKLAFNRWFDEGAVINRYQDIVADIEQTLKFLIGKLGDLSNRYLKKSSNDIAKAWQTLDLESFFLQLLTKTDNEHVRNALYRALANQVQLMHNHDGDPELSANLIETLVLALEEVNTPHLARLDILEILIHQRPTYIRAFMQQLIQQTDQCQLNAEERLFILAALPKILTSQNTLSHLCENLLMQLAEHSYPRVRQSVIEQAGNFSISFLQNLLTERLKIETVDAVRFTLVKQLSSPRIDTDNFTFKLWWQLLSGNESFAIKRLTLELTARMMLNQQLETNQPNSVFTTYINCLNERLQSEPVLAIRRFISRTREQLVAFEHQNLMAELEQVLPNSATLSQLDKELDEELLGRLLSRKAQQSEGYNVSKNKLTWQIRSGYRYAFRLWRFIHEWRNPSTDKRQSFNHSKARKPSAFMHVPSCSVAEISTTNVPGEPLFDTDEYSARPHLPLPDFLLSVLSQDNLKQPAKTYTPDGILLVTPPKSLFQRISSYIWLSINIDSLDTQRKGNEIEQNNYLTALNKHGFSFEFKAYGEQLGCTFDVEPNISKLYNKLSFSPLLVNIWLNFKEYLYSIYQNSIGQLIFFVVGFMVYFWGRHIRISRRIKTDRQAIPVSIGGWGTRGKSGTERLKAALFSSLALKVITKTTGCEATLIYARSNGEQFEVPLFRPFDKASIWEQSDVLHFAKNVKADVFLWECMGLTPRYVKILRQWMQDNFSTITNAYPDHEDILGPTGIDVAKEMANFIAPKSQVFTSEQTMFPILDKDATQKSSTLIQAHWGDGYQITPDIRALYPYEEHPDNIALVCKMAAYIGLEKDFVFKETAQRIVPDIGVLQHFSPVPFTHFSMSFVNSMSANERLATIENWRRLDLFGLSKDPSKQTIALINNRNDRVARSKVFAQMLVEDLPFDKMVVIGTNVDGFYSYYLHAFAERFERIISNNDLQELELLCSQLHCIKEADTVAEIMNKALEGSYQAKEFTALNNAEQFTDWLNGQAQTLSEQQRISLQDVFNHYLSYQQMRPLLSDLKKNQHNLQTILLELVKSKCILITNSKVTPDQLTIMLTALARPHCHQVIIGMQNIKGAGLGYVYGWQQWQKIYDSISMLLDNNCSAEQFKKTLTRLSLISTFSQLEHAYLSSALLEIKKMHHAQNEYSQAELVHINERLNKHQQQLDNKTDSQQQGPLKRFAIQVAESFLDAGAAVKRKKIANQVYKDIATQRITLEKAITVLGKLNRNQKPGWLTFSNKDNS